MHENICKLARAEAVHLIIIPFLKMQEADDVGPVRNLHGLNTNLQASVQCTVRMLVDNGFPHSGRNARFTYNMAVIFMGGQDDWEALAFTTRISGRTGIQMTMIWIVVDTGNDRDDSEGQKKLDKLILGEFKMKNMNNASVLYYETVAEDGIQVLNIIRSLDLDFDLVIMGHQPAR